MYDYVYTDINRKKKSYILAFFPFIHASKISYVVSALLKCITTKPHQSTDKKQALATGLHLYYLSTNENVTPGEGNAVNEFAHL